MSNGTRSVQYQEKYGVKWDKLLHPVEIERSMIRKGGQITKGGKTYGNGLFYHYRELQTLLWPEDDHHRWSDLILSEILQNTITCILGPKDSGKTRCALAKFGLTDYFCFPNETLILISSTDVRGLELRVWGDLKSLFQRAKAVAPWLDGHLIDSKHALATQNLQEEEVRDLRKGIICIPCMSSGGQWTGGLEKYIGIKQKRRRLLGDEGQAMRPSYMEAIANLNSGDFKGVIVGNPIGCGDPLDKLSEPKNGWGTEGEITKTSTWDNKFLNGRTVNLVGTDSPNFDFPEDQPVRYPYLINRDSIARVVAFYGKDSLQYFSQCLGIRKTGLDARRVITKKLCEQFGAFKEAIWKNDSRTKIYAIDAAYGNIGGDRCVGGCAEFGLDIHDRMILCLHRPVIIPVSVRFQGVPEDQIAEYVKNDCVAQDIPAEHVFFDATGRGSLGTSFARLWSAYVNPVEFGGKPTERPVANDFYIYDDQLGGRRLKRCDEHYSKFVSEMWFTVRYIIESSQMRELPMDVADEGCMREWKLVKGDKIEVETKADMKERMGRSPDLFDWLATICEGARRLGFQIHKFETEQEVNDQWKYKLRERREKFKQRHSLNYAA